MYIVLPVNVSGVEATLHRFWRFLARNLGSLALFALNLSGVDARQEQLRAHTRRRRTAATAETEKCFVPQNQKDDDTAGL